MNFSGQIGHNRPPVSFALSLNLMRAMMDGEIVGVIFNGSIPEILLAVISRSAILVQ